MSVILLGADNQGAELTIDESEDPPLLILADTEADTDCFLELSPELAKEISLSLERWAIKQTILRRKAGG